MANKMFRLGILVMVLVFGITVIGCDNGTGTGGSSFIAVTNITNIPQIALMNVEMELNGVVLPSNATNQTITWSGADVTEGKFKATTTGGHMVTATVVNGASETSPYTKHFTITAYADADNKVTDIQGSWTKANSLGMGGTDTFTISNSAWTLKNSGMGDAVYATGIVIKDDGTNYKAQINASGIPLKPAYFFDTGSYVLSGNTITMASNNDPQIDPMSGTWTKK